MILTFLGTGTSTGVPQPRCGCEVCTSTDPHDSRLRCSALLESHGKRLLIDCGPDFRQQMLRLGRPDEGIDALLVTHSHYDHTGGIDDLRPYYGDHPHGMPIYSAHDVAHDLHVRLPYCFPERLYPGAPVLDLHTVTPGTPFSAAGVEIIPLEVLHGSLPILSFRIGPLAYITDCKTMPDSTLDTLRCGVDTLVINALFDNRTIDRQHPTHMNLTQALDVIEKISPRRAYLTHASHRIGLHETISASLPEGVTMAYDGLRIDIPE